MSDRLYRLRAELRGVLQRGIEALPVADRCADELDAWEKPSNLCHDCVDAWLAAHRDGLAVRGWLIDGCGSGSYRLVAHSMVRTRDDALLDVTLPRVAYGRRFIEHPASVEGFFALLCGNPPAHEVWVDVE